MRPVTKHGLTGMNFKRKKMERNNKDYNYYNNLVRRKVKELTIEIKNMETELRTIDTANKKFYEYDKKLNTRSTEVRELEGQLADYNLAFDKQRAGTNPDDIRNLWAHIRQNNEAYRLDLDDLFMERKQQEEQMGAIEEELQEMELVSPPPPDPSDGRKQAQRARPRLPPGVRDPQKREQKPPGRHPGR